MWSEDIAEWNKIIIKKSKTVKKNRVKNGIENLKFFIYALLKQRFYITGKPSLSPSWCRKFIFCDIKFLFRKSVDKKLKIFIFIFHFFTFFITILFHSAISFDHKKVIKFRSLLIRLWSLKKNSLHNKKLDFKYK